jgi:hypothetical protein
LKLKSKMSDYYIKQKALLLSINDSIKLVSVVLDEGGDVGSFSSDASQVLPLLGQAVCLGAAEQCVLGGFGVGVDA